MDFRTALAAVLGVLLGGVLVAFPGAVVRMQTAGRVPHDRSGEYGTGSTIPKRWRRLVQLVGVALLVAGGYFAFVALG